MSTKKPTTQEWAKKATAVHSNKYVYDKVNYKNSKTKVEIFCTSCEMYFEQTPNAHLCGRGCPNCKTFKGFNTTSFSYKAKEVHGNKFNYDKVIYTGIANKVTLLCNVCSTEFLQVASRHLAGSGCRACAQNSQKYTTEDFKERSIATHKDLYDYSKSVYEGMHAPITIICKSHGAFKQAPHTHIRGGGCLQCSIEYTATLNTFTTPDFIAKATTIHKGLYSYERSTYVHNAQQLTITCTTHGDFKQTPNNHLTGSGCPSCALPGFKPHLPGMLYYFKITDGVNTAWKVGITNNSIADRYSLNERKRMSNILSIWYEDGDKCRKEERRILNEYKQHKYSGPDLLKDGNTELFNKDILNL